jgi:hypothetical protein
MLHSSPVPKGPGSAANCGTPSKHDLAHGKHPGAKQRADRKSGHVQVTVSPSDLNRSCGSRSDIFLQEGPVHNSWGWLPGYGR